MNDYVASGRSGAAPDRVVSRKPIDPQVACIQQRRTGQRTPIRNELNGGRHGCCRILLHHIDRPAPVPQTGVQNHVCAVAGASAL